MEQRAGEEEAPAEEPGVGRGEGVGECGGGGGGEGREEEAEPANEAEGGVGCVWGVVLGIYVVL